MFDTKHDTPEWKTLLECLVKLEPDGVIGYEELSELLDRPFSDDRTPLYRAQTHLERDHHRTLECIRNTGYRVVAASEHERLAGKHQRRARRQVRKARNRATSANRSELSQAQRERLDVITATLEKHETMLRRNSTRIETVDERRKESDRRVQSDMAALSARVDDLAQQLEHRTAS